MEILNTIQGTMITEWTFGLYMLLVLVVIGLASLYAGMTAPRSQGGGAMLIGLIMIVLGLWGMASVDTKPTGEYEPTQYEVRITDENYIIDASKYRIVEKRGEIILLEEIKEVAK